ncbi:MAG: hypothetical protein NC399_06675 [Muribaculum sp.]|nr:hypothetical protein [Muribaculum sp.]
MEKEEKIKQKRLRQKKKQPVSIPFLIGLQIFLILFPVSLVWIALWDNVIPRHQTRFASFEAFREKAETATLAWEIPDTAENIKYYWGQDRFVRVAGYGISLPSEAYEQMKQESTERYQANPAFESTDAYVWRKGDDKNDVQIEWLKK